MHSEWKHMALLDHAQQSGAQLVEFVLIRVDGSSYQKPGALVLVCDGQCSGLISGGCLEPELMLRAEDLDASQPVRVMQFDLRDDEGILGFGAGCDGTLSLLARIIPKAEYQNYRLVLEGLTNWLVSRHVDSQYATYEAVQEDQIQRAVAVKGNLVEHWVEKRFKVTIVGAGLDAQLLVQQLLQLGFRVLLVDHRPAHLDDFPSHPGLERAQQMQPNIESDAIVLMSHNLQRDQSALQIALHSNTRYIGLLGPKHRRQKLLSNLSETQKQDIRISGPIGLDLGGRGRAAIALSICAEIQMTLHAASGRRMRDVHG